MSKELKSLMKKAMKKSQITLDREHKAPEEPVMTREQFEEFSNNCIKQDSWRCEITQFVCKDYMCPRLKKERYEKNTIT